MASQPPHDSQAILMKANATTKAMGISRIRHIPSAVQWFEDTPTQRWNQPESPFSPGARRPRCARGVVKLLGQTQIDGLVFACDLEAQQLRARKVVLRQVSSIDESRRRTVALKGWDFLLHKSRSPSCACAGR